MYLPPCANEAVIAKWTGAVPWFLDALHVTRTSANLPTGATQGRANVHNEGRAPLLRASLSIVLLGATRLLLRLLRQFTFQRDPNSHRDKLESVTRRKLGKLFGRP